jgi:uncharacterized phage protein gp47/JayE
VTATTTIAIGVLSASVPVQAVNAGIQGNISAGVLTVLQTGISGVDNVTNATAFTNGIDAESDLAAKARFVAFMASLSKATPAALIFAISGIQQNVQCVLVENEDYSGHLDYGMVTAIVDDGTGSISSTLLTAAQNAANTVRAAGIRVSVFGAVPLTATVIMTVTTAPGYDHATVVGQVRTALTSYINSLGIGVLLPFTRLAQIAYDASAGVTKVSGISLNGGAADLAASARQTIKAGAITVS